MAGVADWWLWNVVMNILTGTLGKERAERTARFLLHMMAEIARLVEGNPDEKDGLGGLKKQAVVKSVIAYLSSIGVWSTYWLHEWFWTWALGGLVDRIVTALKAAGWKNPFELPDEATDDEKKQLAAILSSAGPQGQGAA